LNAPSAAPARIQRAAALLLRLRSPGPRPRSLPPELAPASEQEAYDIQQALALRLEASIGGWKVSMSSMDQGSCAPIFAADLHRTPARVGSLIADSLGIEPEVAFRLRRDLPSRPQGAAYSREDLIAAIDSAHAAIEIVVSRFESHEGAAPLDRLADNISNAGLVLGPACRDWQRLDLRNLPLRLRIRRPQGASTDYTALGGHPQGDPLTPLLWLLNDLARRGGGARAGEYITTGSYAGLHQAPRGAQVLVEFDGLGALSLEVATSPGGPTGTAG
jgi:2-keto-4-pentenoate hydratase